MSPTIAARALLLVAPFLALATPAHAAVTPDARGFSPQEWAARRAEARPLLRPSAAPAAGDEDWGAEFGLPSPDGTLYCATRFGNDLIVGGSFQQIGGVSVNNIARWDGTAWHPLAGGLSSTVTCMMVDQGSLYVGGYFDHADGQFAPSVAKWNGRAWSPVAPRLGSSYCCYGVNVLGMYQGDLVVGGYFGPEEHAVANGIARWNGTAWSPFGEGVSGSVQTMLVSGDSLYIGGAFTSAGGVPAANVALWDGTAWTALGAGTSQGRWNWGVRALTLYHDRIIAAGGFDSAGGQPAPAIASWDGAAWSPIQGSRSDLISSLAVHEDTLYVGAYTQIFQWDGTNWVGQLPGFAGGLEQLISDPAGLIAVGYVGFEDASNRPTGFGVALWDGQGWQTCQSWNGGMKGLATFPGLPPPVYCLASYQGNLVAGGDISYAGTGSDWALVGPISRWDGTGWTAMLSSWPFWSGIAKALLPDADTLFAAGEFTGFPPDWQPSPVLRWNAGQWSALDTLNSSGACLQKYQGRLIVGIERSQPYQDPDEGVRAWNGARWDQIGTTEGAGEFHGVHAMAVHDGLLVVAGQFTSIGGVAANGIASWDGSNWRAFGGQGPPYAYPPFPSVAGIASYQGYLVAAGDFLGSPGHVPLVMWDGSSWTPFEGITGYATAMSVIRNYLCVSGDLHIAALNRDATVAIGSLIGGWWPLGSGLNAPAGAIVEHDGALYVGGTFSQAGGRSAFGVAQWNGLGPIPQPRTPWLSPGRPNPFTAGADFSILLGHHGRVRVAVYDVRGREVAVLDTSDRPAGSYTIRWDGRDRAGQPAPAGVYFINVRDAAGVTSSRKVVRLR